MQLHGIHHLTAVSADARGNHDFYTRVLGMRLVKKTVNQDDVSAYHLFYADGVGSPGSDFTFFDWPLAPAHQIRGLGPITISVPDLAPSDRFLTEVMAMRRARSFTAPDAPGVTVQVYKMGEGGPAAELHVRVEPDLPAAQPGAGGVHHVAFRVRDEEYDYWVDRLQQLRIRSSGPVDRFWFRSLYTREPNGILYEIATDGPGFAADEPLDALGERLVLPPFLEPRRAAIERGLKPI